MTEDNTTAPVDWDAYWRGTKDGSSFSSGGVNHSLLIEFWQGVFQEAPATSPLKIVDVASGNGAVVEIAVDILGAEKSDVTCVDYSTSALQSLLEKFPNVLICEADAKNIPLEKHSFDLATSQYGVEYAGTTAFYEMAGLVKPGGKLAIAAHHANGGIFEECSDAAEAVKRMQAASFITLAGNLLEARFAVANGGNPANYQSAKTRMAPAVLEMKKIMLEYGEHVAGNTIKRLYDDVANINRRITNYEQTEIISWLDQMDNEMESYIGRMESMCSAALTPEQFSEICYQLTELGFSISQREPLLPQDSDLPLAWILIASKQ